MNPLPDSTERKIRDVLIVGTTQNNGNCAPVCEALAKQGISPDDIGRILSDFSSRDDFTFGPRFEMVFSPELVQEARDRLRPISSGL